ncbi:MAG: hypothetical protein J6J62_01205, partial [Oscillospiraceae bacterium]|nr:hypothetical protein [Oscillospiraceae bacterium]
IIIVDTAVPTEERRYFMLKNSAAEAAAARQMPYCQAVQKLSKIFCRNHEKSLDIFKESWYII